jgi:tetratricopeptide (TPR) repeat protein
MASGDIGGQIRFLELLGRGFEEVNRHAEALRFFDRAIKLAVAEKDSGLPFMAYEGKAQALIATGKVSSAKRVLEDALTQARSQEKGSHEVQLLILLGNVAAQMGDKKQAIEYLDAVGQFAINPKTEPYRRTKTFD